MIHIYPAMMGIDEEQIHKIILLKPSVTRVHIDVMDGHFVPSITHGSERINECTKKEELFVWLHLMIVDIPRFFAMYKVPEESLVSFHIEAVADVFDSVKTIKEKKCIPSVAISPKTAVKEIEPFLSVVRHVLVMSVEPGFSGQPFLPTVISKIDALVQYRQKHALQFRIGIDGGINKDNIGYLAKKGVDDFAISSGIFKQPDPQKTLLELHHIVQLLSHNN